MPIVERCTSRSRPGGSARGTGSHANDTRRTGGARRSSIAGGALAASVRARGRARTRWQTGVANSSRGGPTSASQGAGASTTLPGASCRPGHMPARPRRALTGSTPCGTNPCQRPSVYSRRKRGVDPTSSRGQTGVASRSAPTSSARCPPMSPVLCPPTSSAPHLHLYTITSASPTRIWVM
jgi:hypothetical protein